MVVERILALATMLVLAGTFPLAVVAARGFRGAPFGSVLRPLPVILLAYVALNANVALGVSVPPVYDLVASAVATVAALVGAANVLVLLTERRKL
ncbi:hypothetical protein M0R88_14660 [Halorussus gelatinilyticus]|uniref:Uncharacterized protein n=1 Tax=Halorussus gelatinilyticus TaxID=2937524 RepID=A0A8U0II37_9EURY|nr:hypothetical protein [Halorussus gelatinilyticus]UPV99748.1 hypothetical protein M0R88_14660 [Halorussus gelatinilyticus]